MKFAFLPFILEILRKSIYSMVILISISTCYSQTYEVYYIKGNSKAKLQDYGGAIADFTKAMELNPDFSAAYNNRGISKLALGQKDSGCLDLSQAWELGYLQAYNAIRDFCK
ncbi:MAG: tetratricopeptide repeat protein [Saprospiraceae bacterium]|nr:tetratricopeptide repeat protein [Saprospiraceae bacterium]